jgi:hypothetical protein
LNFFFVWSATIKAILMDGEHKGMVLFWCPIGSLNIALGRSYIHAFKETTLDNKVIVNRTSSQEFSRRICCLHSIWWNFTNLNMLHIFCSWAAWTKCTINL